MFMTSIKELRCHDDHRESESHLERDIRGVVAQAHAEPTSQYGPGDQRHQDRKPVEAGGAT
jgi:hypothetical protein